MRHLWRRLRGLFGPPRQSMPPADPGPPARSVPQQRATPQRTMAAAVTEARAKGTADGRSGMFDQWSLAPDTAPRYVRQLQAQREAEKSGSEQAGLRALMVEEARRRPLRARERADQVRAGRLAGRLDETLALMEGARQRMRLLAAIEARVELVRRLGRRGLDEVRSTWTDELDTLNGDPLPAGPYASSLGAGSPAPTGVPAVEAGPSGVDRAAPSRPGTDGAARRVLWEGPAPRTFGALHSWLLLVLLMAVETPIQYYIWEYFHGSGTGADRLFTWVLTASSVVLMVLFPHMAGRVYRARRATGADRLAVLIPLVMLAPWIFVAGMLGYLRAQVIDVPPMLEDRTELDIPLKSEALHTHIATIAAAFICLLLLSGAIGFLLGMAGPHPYQAAYEWSDRRRERIEDELVAIGPAAQLADEAPWSTDLLAEQWRRDRNVIDGIYEAAEHAYYDGVARAMANPAVTDTVTRGDAGVGSVR
ncbi:hypothetical protein [Catellatospora bangladeshensis]|uniref:Uncharacterized protein n=1 Tax=Catellatospora bangladeshensis TaxID=310355 RepID=A0A8J3NM14_9ACTN|nr:hypothetical protein [Catellatospora bangladeshensis]GIF83165.1 hypothetical protein Cba03nite_45140 [Catellatospora bangladeshensis]